jgi:hypothetical protein
VPARIPLLASQSDNMTLLGLTAWISDWPAGKVVGVDLTTRRIIRRCTSDCAAACEFCREVFRVDGPHNDAIGEGKRHALSQRCEHHIRHAQ